MKRVVNLNDIITGTLERKNSKVDAFSSISTKLGTYVGTFLNENLKNVDDSLNFLNKLNYTNIAQDFFKIKKNKEYITVCTQEDALIESVAAKLEYLFIRKVYSNIYNKTKDDFSLNECINKFKGKYEFKYDLTEIDKNAKIKNYEKDIKTKVESNVSLFTKEDFNIKATAELEKLSDLSPLMIDFIKSDKSIFPFNPGTGFGKSTSFRKLLKFKLTNLNFKDSINYTYYITDLKNNIKEEYKAYVNEIELLGYENDAMIVYSNIDSIIEHKSELEKLTGVFNELKSYKALINILKCNLDSEEALKILSDTEKKFRTDCKNKLNEDKEYKKLRNPQEKVNFIKSSKEYSDIVKVYTNINIYNKKNIFINIDKFMNPCDTLIDTIKFYSDNSMLNNSLVFIDESDAMKDKILNFICKNSISEIDLYYQISSIMDKLIKSAPRFVKDNKLEKKLLDDLIIKYNDLENIIPFHDLKFDKDNEQKNHWLFEHSYKNIIHEKNMEYYLIPNTSSEIMIIKSGENIPQEQKIKYKLYSEFVNELVEIFSNILVFLRILINEVQKKETTITGQEMTLSEATINVINRYIEFAKDDPFKQNKLMDDIFNISNSGKCNDIDDLYLNPGQFIKTSLSSNNIITAQIYNYLITTSPEKYLYDLCQFNCKIILSSATAKNKSVLRNFNLNWDKFQDYIYQPTKKAIKLETEYAKEHDEFSNEVEINFNVTDTLENNRKKLLKIIGSKAILTIESMLNSHNKGYRAEEIYSFAIDVINKVENNSYANLALFPYTPQIGLSDEFGIILKELTDKFKQKGKTLIFISANSKNVEEKVKEYHKCLYDQVSQEKPFVFLLSAFATFEKAVNLQYSCIINKDDIVAINKRGKNKIDTDLKSNIEIKLDISGLYIAEITNIFPSLKKEENEATNIADVLSALMYLESLKMNKEISDEDYKDILLKILKKENYPFRSPKFKTIESYTNKLFVTIIQVLGRMARTDYKNKSLNITLSYKIYELFNNNVLNCFINDSDYEKQPFVIKRVLKEIFNKKSSTLPDDILISDINDNIKIHNKYFNNMRKCSKLSLRKNIEEYKFLRKTFKKYGISTEEWKKLNEDQKKFYIKLNKTYNGEYSYDYKEDNNEKIINNIGYITKYKSKVSIDNLELNDNLKKILISAGFSFNKNEEFILTPKGFEIFKGNIGEFIGYNCIGQCFAYPSEAPDELYEVVDGIIETPTTVIGIDYKYFIEQELKYDDYLVNKNKFNNKLNNLYQFYNKPIIIIEINTRKNNGKYESKIYKCKHGKITTIPNLYTDNKLDKNIILKLLQKLSNDI